MGHSSVDVWNYTPRQIAAFLQLGHRRVRAALAQQLMLHTLAARGEWPAIERELRKLTDG
jgi:hypothetical protein